MKGRYVVFSTDFSDTVANFRRLPKTISFARSVRHVLTRRCRFRS